MIANGEAFRDGQSLRIPIKLNGGLKGDEIVTDALKQIAMVVSMITSLS
jgi:hypothetical protein